MAKTKSKKGRAKKAATRKATAKKTATRKSSKPKAGTTATCKIARRGSKLVAVCSGYAYPVLTSGGKGSVKRARAALQRVRGNLCRTRSGTFTRCRGKVAGRTTAKSSRGRKLRCKEWMMVPSPIYGHEVRRCADFVRSRK